MALFREISGNSIQVFRRLIYAPKSSEDQTKDLHVFRRPIYPTKLSENQKKAIASSDVLFCTVHLIGDIYQLIFQRGEFRLYFRRTVMAILVHLEQFSGKLYCNFLPLILSISPVSIHTVLQMGFI